LLLQNYLTLVPSDTYKSDIADISLYDHSKTVVVFAQILYEAFKDYKNKSELYRLSTDKVIDLLKTQNFKVPLIA
jgi:CRISPR/Cas system-associated protein Cas10 (large subunit of type III CRISPR-Cas system)